MRLVKITKRININRKKGLGTLKLRGKRDKVKESVKKTKECPES